MNDLRSNNKQGQTRKAIYTSWSEMLNSCTHHEFRCASPFKRKSIAERIIESRIKENEKVIQHLKSLLPSILQKINDHDSYQYHKYNADLIMIQIKEYEALIREEEELLNIIKGALE